MKNENCVLCADLEMYGVDQALSDHFAAFPKYQKPLCGNCKVLVSVNRKKYVKE